MADGEVEGSNPFAPTDTACECPILRRKKPENNNCNRACSFIIHSRY